jgi:hypothetical protein
MLDDDEPVLERSEGTEIDWKPGKNITVKVRPRSPALGRPTHFLPPLCFASKGPGYNCTSYLSMTCSTCVMCSTVAGVAVRA